MIQIMISSQLLGHWARNLRFCVEEIFKIKMIAEMIFNQLKIEILFSKTTKITFEMKDKILYVGYF